MTIDHIHISAYITLFGCFLVAVGLVVNIIAHTLAVPHRHFVTGQDVANEFVWWPVNVGMLLIAVGVFWIVWHFFIH